MNNEEFLKQFSLIENRLLSMAPDFDPKQKFLNLLKYLHSNRLVSDELITILQEIFQTRNKIMSSRSGISTPSNIEKKYKKL